MEFTNSELESQIDDYINVEDIIGQVEAFTVEVKVKKRKHVDVLPWSCW